MKLKIDTTNVAFMVTGAPEPKEYEGKQQTDKDTGALKWITEVLALEQGENGGELIRVVTAGEKPNLAQGAPVTLDGLVAVPWNQEKGGKHRSGVAYRADAIKPKTGK